MKNDKHNIVINFDPASKRLCFSYCEELDSQSLKIIDIDVPDLSGDDKAKFETVIGSTVLSILDSFANEQINLGEHNQLLIDEAYEVIKKRAKSGDTKAQHLLDIMEKHSGS